MNLVERIDKLTNKERSEIMKKAHEDQEEISFAARWGNLTVEEALKLNEEARKSCEIDS